MTTPIRRRTFAALVALVAAAAALFAFASSHATTANGAALKPASTGAGETLLNGKRGGTLNVFDSEDFLHLDPGEAYFVLDYEIMLATQMQLYTYPPNNNTTIIPELASAMPTVTNGGKTITIHIKSNVMFSPPVSRDVTSADVAYAIERGWNPNVANPYMTYFASVKGAAKANGGPVAGITTPNPTTIVFNLTSPQSEVVIGALTLPISSPVPESYAAPLDKDKPTQYGTSSEIFSGPYMLKSDATGKFLNIGYSPGKSAILVRNPNWTAAEDPQIPAYLDQIDINIGGASQVIGQQVLKGSDSVQNDTPTNTNVAQAYTQYPKQLVAVPGAGDHYVSLNNAHGPFSNVNVRRALYAALDRAAMLKIAGGTIVGQVATHFITPGAAGFSQSGGFAGPKVAWNEYPAGNLTVAEKYMKAAGYPSGKYTGSYTVKLVGSNNGNAPEEAAILESALRELGFKYNAALVDQSVMYGKYCGVPKEEIDLCPEVGWIKDFADPQTILYVPFYGPAIVPTNNSNWGQVNNPAINAAMVTASNTVGAAASANAWAKVDDLLVQNAVAIPWIFDNQPWIESSDVRGINYLPQTGFWDYRYTSLDNP